MAGRRDHVHRGISNIDCRLGNAVKILYLFVDAGKEALRIFHCLIRIYLTVHELLGKGEHLFDPLVFRKGPVPKMVDVLDAGDLELDAVLVGGLVVCGVEHGTPDPHPGRQRQNPLSVSGISQLGPCRPDLTVHSIHVNHKDNCPPQPKAGSRTVPWARTGLGTATWSHSGHIRRQNGGGPQGPTGS